MFVIWRILQLLYPQSCSGTIWKEDMSYVSSEECLYKHLTRERQSEQCRNPTVVVTTTKLGEYFTFK